MAENEEKLLFVVPLSLKKLEERSKYLINLRKKIEELNKYFNYSSIIKEMKEELDELDKYRGDEYEEDYLRYSKK